ncbi:uncharacterized protein LOC131618598 [Vicia villosa]|uniref:uncharacterized protein LOC131618598 n=1 Tax=Vicia villosa TaxID=3911 RepID=UPI00273BBDC5|nr:uncharacterized protein LOC131618598 [Vicia villosa]
MKERSARMKEKVEGEGSKKVAEAKSTYNLQPLPISNEDILFCIDIDPESVRRFDAIKQSILLFVHAKLTINPRHRFAFATLSGSVSSLKKEFSSDIKSAIAATQGLTAATSSTQPDLTTLFQLAAREARKSREQGRILRVILFYCRSAVRPQHEWLVSQKLFTMDILYLHDKPGPDNCFQEVYDALVEILEHVSNYQGYIYAIRSAKDLYVHVLILLSHPQQRCAQKYLHIPKALEKKGR